MFISPQTAIDNKWITGVDNPEVQVQPNAIDFTLDRLYTINKNIIFNISENEKIMRGGNELFPNENKKWTLPPNSVMDGQSSMYVNIPKDVAAMLIIRSTFNRNGIFLTSGLYDSGFNGHISFTIHNRSGTAIIEQGTRIGQIIFVESQNVGMYSGGYNHHLGTHHSEQ